MALADVEIVMDGHRPRRVIITGPDGAPVELQGVVDVALDLPNQDVPVLTIRLLAYPTIRPMLPGEE